MSRQRKGGHLDQLTDSGKKDKGLQRHLRDPGRDACHIEKWIWDRRKDQDCPAAIFVHPRLDPVIDIHAFHHCLAAESCQIAGKLSDRPTEPGCQPHAKWIEDRSHGIDHSDSRRREQHRGIGKQRDQEDTRIAELLKLCYALADTIDIQRNPDDREQSKDAQDVGQEL